MGFGDFGVEVGDFGYDVVFYWLWLGFELVFFLQDGFFLSFGYVIGDYFSGMSFFGVVMFVFFQCQSIGQGC